MLDLCGSANVKMETGPSGGRVSLKRQLECDTSSSSRPATLAGIKRHLNLELRASSNLATSAASGSSYISESTEQKCSRKSLNLFRNRTNRQQHHLALPEYGTLGASVAAAAAAASPVTPSACGFLEFQASHQSLCETKATGIGAGGYKCPPMTSMSQPCMPVTNIGPTKVLPFLYLGSQHDALSQETVNKNGINYILNVSTTCPKPSCIQEGHFLRIPVNDNHSDKLLPHFQDAFQFIDKVREANGCVLIHCLAGISRSPTLAIAYIMKHLLMSTDDAYKYVKEKRPTISPNFNFLGQLLELEKHLREQRAQPSGNSEAHKTALADLRSPTSPTLAIPRLRFCKTHQPELNAQSPTTAFAKLSFGQLTPTEEHPMSPESDVPFKHFATTTLDKLNFTPCFASEEFLLRSSASVPPRSIQGSGTKRPLCLSEADAKTEDGVPSTSNGAAGQSSAGECKSESRNMYVPMRSPESRAKRPSVRPNSIAFSTYPKFDFAEQSVSTSNTVNSNSTTADRGVLRRDRSLEESPAPLSRSRPRVPKHLPVPTMDVSPNRNAEMNSITSRNFEQTRKSRSLEDILNSPEEEERDCGCAGPVHSQRKCRKSVLDMFPQPIGQARCRGTSDPHQSNSSISSSGSHNSLHGSLEVIQVS